MSSELGLVAHYDFNQGSGDTLDDITGNKNDGVIHKAQWVKRKTGYCLAFNGINSYVDCGDSSLFDLPDGVTLEAWVFPEGEVHGEAGILGKRYDSYFLSYYKQQKCYWYINSDNNSINASLSTGSWHHVVGTFNHALMKLYIDGKMVNSRPLQSSISQSNHKFLIGVTDPPNPPNSSGAYFQGLIDDVKVYNRALSEGEVKAHFRSGALALAELEYTPVKTVAKIQQGQISVGVGKHGQVQISNGAQKYLIESTFSYPGSQVGWNYLTGLERTSEWGWTPTVKKGPNILEIAAKGKFYELRRSVQIQQDKIQFEDRLINLRTLPTGMIVWNRLTAPNAFKEAFTPEFGENPTIFLATEQHALGVLAQDDLSRLRFEPSIGLPANQARFKLTDFALDVDKEYTSRWTLYLLNTAEYFDFVNRIRQDWNSNFIIEGPFAFIDANPLVDPLNKSDEDLYKYLKKKHLKIVALSPFLDYDPGSFGHVLERRPYKELMQKAIGRLKAVDPNIQCIGSIETDWVTIHPDDPTRQLPPPAKPGKSGPVTLLPEQTKIIDSDSNISLWKDSMIRNEEGNLILELYNRGGKPQTALRVYPAVGNYQYAFLLDQIKFLLDGVGLDGVYIDEFSLAWWQVGGQHTYPCWDGWSADIDQSTGEVVRKFTDCSLVGRTARVKLCEYILNKGKIVVANSWATSHDEQDLHVSRFAETWGAFDPEKIYDAADFPDGTEPLTVAAIFRGNLGSPIGLGTQVGLDANKKLDTPTGKRLMKSVIAYLRHGTLYYHYHIGDLPDDGQHGEYGPINHMFPITPVALHRGWIEGKERIITAKSGTYHWNHSTMPNVHWFDIDGKEVTQVPPGFLISPKKKGWEVNVVMKDWHEIVVIE